MSYEQKASRATPLLIILLIDDSGSKADPLPGTNDAKFKWVELYCKSILYELLRRSTESKNGTPVIKPRYYFTVIKYGSVPQFWGDPLMDIETVVRKFTENGDSFGLGGKLGGTDSKAGFEFTYNHLAKILNDERFKNSPPPIVVHETDGESQTDATSIVEQIKQLSTTDGNALVMNAYIGTQTMLNYKGPEDFTGYVDVAEVGSSQDNIRLFEMSSVIPPSIEENLKSLVFPNLRPNSRLFFDVRTKDMMKQVFQTVSSIASGVAK